jgi:hypothetical protein
MDSFKGFFHPFGPHFLFQKHLKIRFYINYKLKVLKKLLSGSNNRPQQAVLCQLSDPND